MEQLPEFQKLSKELSDKSKEFIKKYEEGAADIEKSKNEYKEILKQIESETIRFQDKDKELTRSYNELTATFNYIKYYGDQIFWLEIVSWFIFIIGWILMFLGFYFWYVKVQKFNDLILENQSKEKHSV